MNFSTPKTSHNIPLEIVICYSVRLACIRTSGSCFTHKNPKGEKARDDMAKHQQRQDYILHSWNQKWAVDRLFRHIVIEHRTIQSITKFVIVSLWIPYYSPLLPYVRHGDVTSGTEQHHANFVALHQAWSSQMQGLPYPEPNRCGSRRMRAKPQNKHCHVRSCTKQHSANRGA